MSRRHHGEPAPRLTKFDRRVSHHRERSELRAVLLKEDPEAIVDPVMPHSGAHGRPATGPERPRHWKLPFWKRRSATRRARAREAIAGRWTP